jgi:hypothetical protein
MVFDKKLDISLTSWGADRTCMLRLYRALIRSKLDFGSLIYNSARPDAELRRLSTRHSQEPFIRDSFYPPFENRYILRPKQSDL